MANDIDPIDDTSEFTIVPRRGVEVFVNTSETITFQQTVDGHSSVIILHPEEVRELLLKIPKFMNENFPVD